VIIKHVIHGQQIDGVRDRAGHLASTVAVEAINYEEKPDWADEVAASVEPSLSRKRKLTVNMLYSGNQFGITKQLLYHFVSYISHIYFIALFYCCSLPFHSRALSSNSFSILGLFSVDFQDVWVTRSVISAEASVTRDIDQISSSAGTRMMRDCRIYRNATVSTQTGLVNSGVM
jgi:hypothetical protein